MARWAVAAALYSAVMLITLPLVKSEATPLALRTNSLGGADQSIPFYNPQPKEIPQGSGHTDVNPVNFQPDMPKAVNGGQTAATTAAGALPDNNQTPTPSPAPNDTTATPENVTPAPTPTMTVRCVGGQVEMSVENVPGIFCVKGSRICSGSINGSNCPGIQAGLGNDSHCGIVRTGVYGCLKSSATPT
ncbi:hypothetical protein FI667_g6071, partial [Globisporangium splendens]